MLVNFSDQFAVRYPTSPCAAILSAWHNEDRAVEIPAGRYRHYKGAEYEVLLVATHSETEERLVVYRALYGEFGYWVRPLDMFTETVVVNGETIPRFALVEAVD